MARIVMKFGGTSVANVDLIVNASKLIKKEWDNGNDVAVVVSAMGDSTDKLVNLINQVSDSNQNLAEYDSIVSSGEQVSSGLLALQLNKLKIPARSWLGWQLPILTTGKHSMAKIHKVFVDKIIDGFKKREIAIIAGFQGILKNLRISTIGRGGSDTSAVYIASALNADRCDIYTDVEGVFTADPDMSAKVKKLDKIAYEEMIEMSSQGASVLQTTSVVAAMNENVNLNVLSAFDSMPGTQLVHEDDLPERKTVTGVAYSINEAKITLIKVEDRPGVASKIFHCLAEAGINVDMIVQNISEQDKKTDITFTINKEELSNSLTALKELKKELNYEKIVNDPEVGKISVIGFGMIDHVGVAQLMFETLSKKDINIQVISTSEIKISVLVARKQTIPGVRALHDAFGLDNI